MWVWEKLSAAKWLDAWEDRFHGDPRFVVHVLKGGRTLRVEVFRDTREEAEAIVERFGGRVRQLKDVDWQKPQSPPPPIKIRDRFLVTQQEEDLEALVAGHPGREVISIPPEMAFGTGDHATTSTCLRLLVDIGRRRRGAWSCADLGCGTGVLSVVAAKLGADPVFACDFDPFAVTVTERNAARNGTPGVTVEELDVLKWNPDRRYDVVVANLFSSVLIEAFPVIAKLLGPGGDLVLSGILADQAWEVFEAAAGRGLGFPQVIRKGKWVTARGGWMEDLAGTAEG